MQLTLTDDAGVLVPAPDGGLSFTFTMLFADGGVTPFAMFDTRVPSCVSGSDFSNPRTMLFPAGASSMTIGVRHGTAFGTPDSVSLRASGAGLIPTEKPFVMQRGSLDQDFAVLPLYAVTPTGQVSLRQYALVDYSPSVTNEAMHFLGFLSSTTPSTHAIRIGNRLVMNWAVYDPLTGANVGTPPAAFTPIDGITRVFSDRVVLFGTTTNSVRFQAMQIVGSSVIPYALSTQTAQVQGNGTGGEIAALLTRNTNATDGTVTLAFTSLGSQVPLVSGTVAYTYSTPGMSESWGTVSTTNTSLPLGTEVAHAGMSLDNNRALIVVGGGTALNFSSTGSRTAQLALPDAGPEQFVNISRSDGLIASIGRSATSTARLYEFLEHNPADGGVRTLGTAFPDLNLTTGTRAITNPNLARGCVVNDSFGVTFFYSTRVLADSTYQHWFRTWNTTSGMFGAPMPM
jgi:hypothetical protein